MGGLIRAKREPLLLLSYAVILSGAKNPCISSEATGWPTIDSTITIGCPIFATGFIVAKVGNRAKRDPALALGPQQ
jgi:hypothetical protein